MSRNRVRRSFTVETKVRGRQAPAFLPVRAPLLENVPERPAHRLFEAVPAPSAERPEPRRILPNLIPAPAVEPEPEPVHAAEPRLPRVRRVALRRAKAEAEPAVQPKPKARPEAAKPRPAAKVVPAPVASAPADVPPPRVAEQAPRRSRREGEDLRIGERWKRRLPRVCW